MKTIELVGHVDDQHRLNVEMPVDIPPGPVRVVVELAENEEEEAANGWAAAVARCWAADWSDPREDIYTLEDGEPIDGSR